MPKGDDQEIVQITRKEWNELTTLIREIHDKLCGNENLGQDGMIDEHDRMYRWYLEQKLWSKKTVSIISVLGGILGIAGMIISIILNSRNL